MRMRSNRPACLVPQSGKLRIARQQLEHSFKAGPVLQRVIYPEPIYAFQQDGH